DCLLECLKPTPWINQGTLVELARDFAFIGGDDYRTAGTDLPFPVRQFPAFFLLRDQVLHMILELLANQAMSGFKSDFFTAHYYGRCQTNTPCLLPLQLTPQVFSWFATIGQLATSEILRSGFQTTLFYVTFDCFFLLLFRRF